MEASSFLEMLSGGAKDWNEWRQRNASAIPDLTGVDLKGANLREVDFERANLLQADLQRADLQRASLIIVDLRGALLLEADLDDDPESLRKLLEREGERLTWEELRRIRQYTVNFNPAVEIEMWALREGDQPVESADARPSDMKTSQE